MASQKDGKKGQRGGLARAAALSEAQKREIAKRAAESRWLRATHKGSFQEDFGFDVDCYVLSDAKKTAVISQRGMGAAIGLSSSGGQAFPRFVAKKGMTKHLGADLVEKIQKPIKFQWAAASGQPPSEVNGYDVTLLIDVCKAILSADSSGDLSSDQKAIAVQARIILNASAKSGIQNLVYKLAGYDATREEAVAAFKLYVQEEAKKYEQEFPNELYEQWYRLYDLPIYGRGKPWYFKHLTVNHIYYPLAQSQGRILELMRALKANDGDRQKKLFQFLSEIGARALRIHIGRVLEMGESSVTRAEYEVKLKGRFGSHDGQGELNFGPAPDPVIPSDSSSMMPLPSEQSSSAS